MVPTIAPGRKHCVAQGGQNDDLELYISLELILSSPTTPLSEGVHQAQGQREFQGD